MKTKIVATLLLVLLTGSFLRAQEAQPAADAMPAPTQPTREHEWLKKFVGEWEADSEVTHVPGEPPMACNSVIKTRALGDLWVVSELKTEAAGASVNALQTIGFDTQQGKFIGSWIDSMFDHMWRYEGSLDDSGRILTLEADGPDLFGGDKPTKYRDVYEFQTDDHVVVKSMALKDGEWVTFAHGNARRK